MHCRCSGRFCGAETFSKSGTWGAREVELGTKPARGASEMGGRMRLAHAERVGFSAPPSGSAVGRVSPGGRTLGQLAVAGGLRPAPGVAAAFKPQGRDTAREAPVPLVWFRGDEAGVKLDLKIRRR